jgi:anthranilate synthase component 1
MATEPRPTLDEVAALLDNADAVPVVMELPTGALTPVEAMRILGTDSPCFLLESAAGPEHLARWSILGHHPVAAIECDDSTTDPLDVLHREVASLRFATIDGLDVPFAGGAVGFLSYEAVRHYERVPSARDVLRIPDAWFGIYDTVVAFDHVKERVLLIGNVRSDGRGGVATAYGECVRRLADLERRLERAPGPAVPVTRGGDRSVPGAHDDSAAMSRDAFYAAVERCHEYILAGDIFQVQISRRFALPLAGDAFEVYGILRDVNPSPYMFYLATPHGALVGASPEMLVRVTGEDVEYHPIAGTRRRGRTPADDARMEAELRGSEKEAAEHLMLVDLGRNDLGRVCATGSVRVTELMEVERYSHVMHLVSGIEGVLATGVSSLDALRACFPAGTVTGAPKIRAMEIIAELEPEARGAYAGAVGYVGWGGNLDTAIALRTLLVRDGIAYAQAAAGIVADSTAAEEALEIDNKAAAMVQAVAEVNAR